MPTFQNHADVQSTINEITEGLKTADDMVGFARSFCRIYDETVALSGILPGLTSEATLARMDNARLLPGEDANDQGGGSEVASYLCLASQGYSYISQSELQQIGGASGLKAMERITRVAMNKAYAQEDWHFASRLSSETLNKVWDCNVEGNGEWDDTVNGTPLDDLLEMIDTLCPIADSLIYGPAVRRALVKHPNISSEFTHWSGGGVLDKGALPGFLAAKTGLPVENIKELRVLINTADAGQTVTPGFVFNTGAWIGKRENCVFVDPAAPAGGFEINGVTDVDKVIRSRGVEVSHVTYTDTVRANVDSGCFIKNAITA